MTVKDIIGSTPVKNEGGKRASKGFSYQHHWSVRKLVELHAGTTNYVMLFEVFEDVAVLDDLDEPTRLDLYQVKSRESQSPYSLSDLTQTRGGNSFIGKLMLSREGLPEELKEIVGSLNFVSNCSYSRDIDKKFHNSPDVGVSITTWHRGERLEKKVRRLEKQTSLSNVDDLCEITFLIRSPLEYHEPERSIRDLLTEFFKQHVPNYSFDINPFYESLLGEVKRKGECNKPDGYTETVEHKGITRDWMQQMVSRVNPSMKVYLDMIVSTLQNEGWAAEKIVLLKDQWRSMEIENMRYENSVHNNLMRIIAKIVPEIVTLETRYIDTTEDILNTLKINHRHVCGGMNDYYVRALILWNTLNYRVKILEN